jgi:SNF2 family DNA or RNA helicase
VKTYGTYTLMPACPASGNRRYWVVTAAPHVMARLKRIFPRVLQARSGALALSDSAEVARDLEWVNERWPLVPANDESAMHLGKRAEAHRAAHEQVMRILEGERPDYGWRDTALPAREYQLTAADLAHATGRLLLADDVGLGKTLSGALVLRNPAALPALVVTLTHLPLQWQREIKRFMPWLSTHIVTRGQPYDPTKIYAGRGRQRRPLCERDPDVLIMSYSKLAGWGHHLAGKIRTVLFDEMQELRHHETARYIAAAQIADGADFRMGLTATPVYNYGDEIHSVVQVLDGDALGSQEEFKREWCTGDDNVRRAKVKDPAALGVYLRDEGIMLRRTRAEVGRELPPIINVEQNVDVDPEILDRLTGDAAQMAQLVLDKAADRTDRWNAAGQLDMRMRHATGVAKAAFVAEFVRLLLESEERIVLWGWHRDVYDVWCERLAEFNPVLYTGSESPNQKEANAESFKSGGSRILIMSLRSGAGLDGLQDVCKVGVFGELDWSPMVHHQAIGRLSRDGQTEPVVAYYLVSDEGADPPIAEVLDIKRQQSEPIMNPDGALFTVAAAETDRAQMLAREVLRRSRRA